MTKPLILSSNAVISTEKFGAEEQPILIADHALDDADAVVEIAARQHFQPIGQHFPGLRVPVPKAAAMELVKPIAAEIMQSFQPSKPLRFEECYLSLVTARPENLTVTQRLPHYDGAETDRIAILLYLDKAEQGGTAFYRHRDTGFESINSGRRNAYHASLERELRQHGLPQPDYLRGETVQFEQTHAVEGKFNRAILYRGNSLHCGMLQNGFKPKDNPKLGRLTLNLFLCS